MTPQELEALFGQQAPSTTSDTTAQAPTAPAAPPPASDPTGGYSAEQLFGPSSDVPATAEPAIMQDWRDASGRTIGARQPQAATEPGLASRIASDIGTGITELPRAAVKGARDAAQESAEFVRDISGWQAKVLDPLFGLFGAGPTPDAPKLSPLPDINAPTSTTGKLATTVSQFVTGLVGLGKVTKPLEAAAGLAKAGRAAKLGVEAAKGATVGATAFDPFGPRLADLVESVPALSNPVTRYLKADPTDTAAEGRIKNALESIGMDAALMGGVMLSAKLYRVIASQQAGKATQADVDHVIAEVEAQGKPTAETANPTAPENPSNLKADAPSSAPETPEVRLDATPAQSLDAPTSQVPTRDVMELGSGQATASPKRDVLDLSAPKADPTVSTAVDAVSSPRVEVTPEHTTGLLKAMRDDADALARAEGDWNRAIDEGHIFGGGARIPWQKLRVEGPEGDGLGAFMMRLADETEAQHNVMRGGDANGVLSDARVQALVTDSARLFGGDPMLVTGRLAMAGDAARRMAVELEVSYTAANRALQDAYALAARIRAGDLTEFAGNAETAAEALRLQLADAGTLYGYGQAIRSGAGRTMRRMRQEFGPKAEDIEAMRSLNSQALIDAIMATGGDPRAIQKLTSRSALGRLGDALEFSYVNGLLWSPRSHFVNFATNAYMVGFRPLERIVGGGIVGGIRATANLVRGDAAGVQQALSSAEQALHQGFREYSYIGSTLSSAWKMAVEAWQRGDSLLSPHGIEALSTPRINPAQLRFKTPDNLPAVLHNAMTALVKVTGFPTRALGTVDEFVQQVVYRSKVQANAHTEGARMGLDGDVLTAHVRDKLHAAFDDNLRATDAVALQEARTATFQQDLLPGTIGHTLASAAVKHRVVRYVMPFVRTPTNVLRYGQKLTPLLQLAQKEYREMLWGRMGAEAQAQAVGQFSIGALFFGYAGFLASSGVITGSGPTDPKLRTALMATGWQPYSIVKLNADGTKTYTNYGRYDPVGLPLGIAADIVNAISNSEDGDGLPHQIQDALTAASFGLVKQLSNKSYFKGLSDALEAITEPDRAGEKFMGQTASNFIPFSSALRFANPDDHMRDARTVADRMLATIPGLSDKVPPRRDAWGDPITIHKGLWATDDGSLVDAEMTRMALEAGFAPGAPSYTVGGVDLRDITMVNGRNAYDQYQDWAARPHPKAPSLKETVAKIIQSPAYQRAPDGDAGTRGTKLWMLSGRMAKYRERAAQRMRGDKNVREAMLEKRRDVAKAYAAKSAPQTPEKTGKDSIANIGKAFGVDLDGLMQ